MLDSLQCSLQCSLQVYGPWDANGQSLDQEPQNWLLQIFHAMTCSCDLQDPASGDVISLDW